MTYRAKCILLEIFKRSLREKNLPPKEYERREREFARKIKL